MNRLMYQTTYAILNWLDSKGIFNGLSAIDATINLLTLGYWSTDLATCFVCWQAKRKCRRRV